MQGVDKESKIQNEFLETCPFGHFVELYGKINESLFQNILFYLLRGMLRQSPRTLSVIRTI
jgi:hypothetical protein